MVDRLHLLDIDPTAPLDSVEEFKPVDPLEFASILWPDVKFYKRQKDVIYSVEENDETFVYAGNQLGKDFVAGFIALSYFLRYPVVRIITTSVKDDHLRVLWSELDRFIKTAKYPIVRGTYDGVRTGTSGPLVVNHRDIHKYVNGRRCSISYMRGMVSERAEGLAGHHAPYTLALVDEASFMSKQIYDQLATWAKRILCIGNPMETTGPFFEAWKRGDMKAKEL